MFFFHFDDHYLYSFNAHEGMIVKRLEPNEVDYQFEHDLVGPRKESPESSQRQSDTDERKLVGKVTLPSTLTTTGLICVEFSFELLKKYPYSEFAIKTKTKKRTNNNNNDKKQQYQYKRRRFVVLINNLQKNCYLSFFS